MRKLMLLVGALGAVVTGFVVAWRRNPRIGSGFMNTRINPFVVERGLAGGRRAEIGTLEHFGRRTGTRHLTPVHPEPIENGFRFIVPLGLKSEWARNVLAAGHCRLQLHDFVYELDEPAMLLPREMCDLPAPARTACAALGFTYLRLHRFAEHPGTLEDSTVPAATESVAAEALSEVLPSREEAPVS